MAKKKLVHITGEVVTPKGRGNLIEDCDCKESGSSEEREVFVSMPLESGKPVRPGTKLVQFRKVDDEHMECEEISTEGHSGPVQVSTPSYREGWERIFGKNGVN